MGISISIEVLVVCLPILAAGISGRSVKFDTSLFASVRGELRYLLTSVLPGKTFNEAKVSTSRDTNWHLEQDIEPPQYPQYELIH